MPGANKQPEKQSEVVSPVPVISDGAASDAVTARAVARGSVGPDSVVPISQNAAPLAYELNSAAGIRSSLRILVLLTFINTVLLGTYVVGPGLGGYVKQEWASFQQARAARQAADAQHAADLVQAAKDRQLRVGVLPFQQQCMDYVFPPQQLLFAEDPEGIAQLTNAGPVYHIGTYDVSRLSPGLNWKIPVAASPPACFAHLPASIDDFGTLAGKFSGLVFLHRLQAKPSAPVRLVMIFVDCTQHFLTHEGDVERSNDTDTFAIWSTRHITADLFSPGDADGVLKHLGANALELSANRDALTQVTDYGGGKIRVDYKGLIRLLAGQPNAEDTSRFSIPYSIDGEPGAIEGRLTEDDQISFKILGPLITKTSDIPVEPPSATPRHLAHGMQR